VLSALLKQLKSFFYPHVFVSFIIALTSLIIQ